MFVCSCDYDDNNPAEFYSAKIVTARTKHECCECGTLIDPGEKYEYVAGKWDDEFAIFTTCCSCARIRDELFPCGVGHGTLWPEVHETYCLASRPEDDFCICPPRKP